jgi:hypothetical protein
MRFSNQHKDYFIVLPFEREKEYAVNYKETLLRNKFYADFIV